MQTKLLNYQQTLKDIIASGTGNEHTFRTAFENLINSLKPHSDIKIIHEPKAKGQGNIRPDFKVICQTQGYDSLLGFIECKNYGADLSPLVKGKQIEKYLSVCHNIILTDYNRFILLSYDKIEADLTLFSDLQSTPNQAESIKIQNNFSLLLQKFFGTATTIANKDELVKILSTQAFYLSETISKEAQLFNSQFQVNFNKSLAAFNDLENITFELVEFCDILAQSIVYGMFVAHIESERFDIDKIPTESFTMLLPEHFATLKEFILYSLPPTNLPESIKYALENIIKTITLIDKQFFKGEIRGITTYLYEDFLREYDKLRNTDKKKSGGVYYTPEPIVDMITHSINELLQRHFDKTFSDEQVKVLDFATGTGSFLEKVFEIILDNQSEVFTKETIINKCFKDIYGFEISFVPYIVAHLKLSAILKNRGFSEFKATQKFQVFLTNTLDLNETRDTNQILVPFANLKNECDTAIRIKHKDDLLVILGNPPYNVKSKNKGVEILNLLQSYKQGLNETKINLDDDYIKFIRFAQWKLTEQSHKKGVMGFITNNSYLNGRTHRKMRESLAQTFDEIYILNLHGDNSSTNSINDKNVFDIRVGVCISIFVKYKDSSKVKNKLAKVHYFSTQDNAILRRNDKFALLNGIAQNGLDSIKWQTLTLESPYFWFVPKDFSNAEYENFWALASDKALGESKAIFEDYNSGIQTKRDETTIQFSKNQMQGVLRDFIQLDKNALATKYNIRDSRDWQIDKAKAEVIAMTSKESSLRTKRSNSLENKITQIIYRPFDLRYTFTSGKTRGFLGYPRFETMKHFLIDKNLGLCFPKTCLNPNFDYGIIIDKIADIALGGKNTGSETYIAPLYRYDEIVGDKEGKVSKIVKIPNFTKEFSEFAHKHKVLKNKSPEQILAYIYGNLYNPAYRAKYIEYLKIGFPRIDFEISQAKFEAFANLGQKLIDLHLMKIIPQDSSVELKFRVGADKSNPNFVLDKPKFVEGKIVLNKDLEIVGVSAEVWDYTIGGYKVLDKWLKYRVGLKLEKEDFTHLESIAKILKATIAIQRELAQI